MLYSIKCESWDQINDGVNTFKVLQLICQDFNGAYSSTVIPALKYGGSFAGMVCVFVAIRGNASMPGVNYAFLLFSVIMFGGTILLVNGISTAWTFSAQFLVRAQKNLTIVKEKERRLFLSKVINSLSPLRVCVGGKYYMEKEAKLTFINFLVNGVVNLLLSSK